MKGELKMIFEVGKFYKHNSGGSIHIVSEADTLMYGNCLVAESSDSSKLLPIGRDETNTIKIILK